MQIFTLIPSETKLSILFLVIMPAIIVGFLRFRLHRKLQIMNDRISRLLSGDHADGIQPPIVERLRSRYQKASQKLEHVNTIALIDSVYKDEKLSYLGIKVQYDRADSITRVLPNLLIAFGLIGTFLGITSNLTNISSVITSLDTSNPDIGKLVQGLQPALRDMGVAFSASLFGLSFGSLLTIFNTIWNTSVAKHQLVAGLEDYLDNIYKPTFEGNTRLDTAIDRMVKQQEEFLLRFHENVGRALETSFGKAANQIATECSKINRIAENVYTNFSNAAGTIATGATTFELAANSLQAQNQIFTNSLQEFKTGVHTFQAAAHGLEQNNIVQNIDRTLAELNTSQQAFTNSTKTLETSLEGITSSNQNAAQLAEKVYQSWDASIIQIGTASGTIENGAKTFSQAANLLESQTQIMAGLVPHLQTGVASFVSGASKVENNNIVHNIDRVLTELNTSQQAFTNSTKTLEISLEGITSSNKTAAELAQSVYKTWQSSTSKIDKASETISNGATLFQKVATSLEGQTQTLVELLPHVQAGVNTWQTSQAEFAKSTDAFSQSSQQIQAGLNIWRAAQTDFAKSTDVFSRSAQQIQPVVANLEPAITAINRSAITLQQFGGEVANLSKNTLQVSESSKTTIANFDRQHQTALNTTQSLVQNLKEVNRSSWQELQKILNQQITADRSFHEQLLAAMKEHLAQMSLRDREHFTKLITVLDKSELGSNKNSMFNISSN